MRVPHTPIKVLNSDGAWNNFRKQNLNDAVSILQRECLAITVLHGQNFILANFSNEDENENEEWCDPLGPGTRTTSTAAFRRKQIHLANRLRYVDESLPTVKITRENVF